MASVVAKVRVHEWLRGLGGEDVPVQCYGCMAYYLTRHSGKNLSDCATFGCITKCKGKELKCGCKCCKEKCREPDACKPIPPPPPPPPPALPDAQHLRATEEQSSDLQDHTEDSNLPPSPPSPQAIAAVIVAIIVAIILLDLCIFRFPVGRNIRDFLVRKIPFCIAFYS
ncbi:hypothetical protein BBBOND_0109090 [Babesia bigemina]|uniref:Uncharacterized protein n=1 Tax=Babesia bigemina TaxID=5866 RepID=A0A061D1D0_BABBI|nr:hypothetical protein BBBOND_0109090 [Babesia bigemina]CDR94611.1 hypothetical protein BBBOND_0109090 [Babesia bigemina]|eukprot:XP_012766797.1 hypothetical protein BBBOND_0109090 [Babesia bigemina]